MTIRRALRLSLTLLAIAVATAGCIQVPNPFQRAEPKSKYAGKGERIPLAAYDESLHAASALKGQDFYLPPPTTVTDWPGLKL